MKFESAIDFELVLKMTDGDCSSIYGSKVMNRTYVENCIRVESFKLGNKIDFKPLIGHFTDDNDKFRSKFEKEYMASINENSFDIYNKFLIQTKNRMFLKKYDDE